jgi:hypothetical protein
MLLSRSSACYQCPSCEEKFPDCEDRCDAIGLKVPCIEQPGCGWCGATGRCLSGSFFKGPCKVGIDG